MKTLRQAFTLIELLIVVAIIAILAAIAVPNFLEAQVRSKVSRAKADMRSIATAIESYAVDNNHYPNDRYDWDPVAGLWLPPGIMNWNYVLNRITTPLAYMSSLPQDVFTTQNPEYSRHSWYLTKSGYWSNRSTHPKTLDSSFFGGSREKFKWLMLTPGPDLWYEFDRLETFYPGAKILPYHGDTLYYDPTNGTTSQGDLYVYGSGNEINPLPNPIPVP